MSDKPMYHVVWIDSGERYAGTLRPTHDKQALEGALTEILETVSGLRGKLEVREMPESQGAAFGTTTPGTGNTETPVCQHHGKMTRIGENWTCVPCIEERPARLEARER